jgi:hypothetical protein
MRLCSAVPFGGVGLALSPCSTALADVCAQREPMVVFYFGRCHSTSCYHCHLLEDQVFAFDFGFQSHENRSSWILPGADYEVSRPHLGKRGKIDQEIVVGSVQHDYFGHDPPKTPGHEVF